VPSRESGSKRHRPPIAATEQSASRRYVRKPGIAVFIGRHIFNRSFRNDVNAGLIPFGERTAIKVSLLASKLGARWTNLIPLISPRVAIFCTAVAARCADIVPVSQRAMRFLPQTVR
jgi:hypothetical protein